MEHISKGITNVLIRNSITSEEQKPIVAFGIETAIYKFLHLGVAVLIGLLFGRVIDIIIFHLFYQKLRTYAGGHHAKSNAICFLNSCVIAVATLTFWSLCPNGLYVLLTAAFLILSVAVILWLAPVEAENKPLEKIERKVYRKRAVAMTVAELILIVLLSIFGLAEVALVGATALLVLAVMLVLGKLKNVFNIVSKYTK